MVNDLEIQAQKVEEEAIRRHAFRDCSRYLVQDAYTITELLRSYERLDSIGKIDYLKSIFDQGVRLPKELEQRVVTDPDVSVREWTAREAPDLRQEHIEAIKEDADPFVRAVLRENRNLSYCGLYAQNWIREFLACDHLARLAMMRNQNLAPDLVLLILDRRNDSLGLNDKDRFELARAGVANTNVIETSRRVRTRDFADGYGYYLASEISKKIWHLSAAWPEDSGLQYFAFQHVQTDDATKAEVYVQCKDALLRRLILESCLLEDVKTTALGRQDIEATNRSAAYRRTRDMNKQEIENAIADEKESWVLDTLLRNPWVGAVAREIVQSASP